MSARFEGKVAIVTGGASGIGLASARRLLEEGATVVIADISAAAGEQAVVDLRGAGLERVEAIATDVADDVSVAAMVTATVERHRHVDVLFNNAGIFIPGTVAEMAVADWDRVIGVNLRSVFLVSRHVVPHMVAQGYGAIVNNASIAAVVGDVNGAAYCASKGGVGQLTRAMALDHARQGIRVNAICCAEIDTPLFEREAVQIGMTVEEYRAVLNEAHPVGRIGLPSEAAAAVAFLASDDASFITGTLLNVDGGYSAA
jgi:meso-butanediol dehydrogenase / (S,S)-butanediol dehydrogenase / diacetyl reductase